MKVSKLFVKVVENDVVILDREVKSAEMLMGSVAFVNPSTHVVFEERECEVDVPKR